VLGGGGGQIITESFDRYPVMPMQSVPRIGVPLIEWGEPPTGVARSASPRRTRPDQRHRRPHRNRIRRLAITKTFRVF
jgi:hypothetical protein